MSCWTRLALLQGAVSSKAARNVSSTIIQRTPLVSTPQTSFINCRSQSTLSKGSNNDAGSHNKTGLSPVAEQLSRVAELQSRVSAENSKTVKQQIIAEYPDLRQLLEYIYEPTLRTHLTHASLKKHILATSTTSEPINIPNDIINLFDKLSNRIITGNVAKNTTYNFLLENGIIGNEKLLDTFGRLLDRNLVAGFGANTLQQVNWSNQPERSSSYYNSTASTGSTILSPKAEEAAQSNLSESSFSSLITSNGKTPIHPLTAKLGKFEVALGKSLEPPFEPLFINNSDWFASRKLDGVRCITFLDFLIPPSPPSSSSSSSLSNNDNNGHVKLVSIHFVSRTGKEFKSLSKLEEQLKYLENLPNLEEKYLNNDPLIIEERPEGVVKRLVLDGEICVMRPKTKEELSIVQEKDEDGSSLALSDGMWVSKDPLIEDFTSTVSLMKRSTTIEHLSYFVFDCLSFSELNAKTSLVDRKGLGKKFESRIEDIRYLNEWLNGHLDKLNVKEKMVKDLKQIKVINTSQVEEMIQRASNEGWEGIILRKNVGYKGKRSPDIRKFKKWQDGEYVVKSIDTSLMRLSVNGKFNEYKALSNVWIEHFGHPVSVGSGFTAEQRIKFAENPKKIIGKQITVEYFSESDSWQRDKKSFNGKSELKSLRFPRVKMIWGQGKRTI
ncbi:uncharacterized protein L201_008102 [Kwoniella dendrophila CBS 6074]|uniref:ATP-dependent DNA ligase family profile domain-containing protein n=1 Tax=Kwoniella dendrophila CBS 6074 TaxID=1295534 RepID=A0AAX4K8H5_9TREE